MHSGNMLLDTSASLPVFANAGSDGWGGGEEENVLIEGSLRRSSPSSSVINIVTHGRSVASQQHLEGSHTF